MDNTISQKEHLLKMDIRLLTNGNIIDKASVILMSTFSKAALCLQKCSTINKTLNM